MCYNMRHQRKTKQMTASYQWYIQNFLKKILAPESIMCYNMRHQRKTKQMTKKISSSANKKSTKSAKKTITVKKAITSKKNITVTNDQFYGKLRHLRAGCSVTSDKFGTVKCTKAGKDSKNGKRLFSISKSSKAVNRGGYTFGEVVEAFGLKH